MFPQDIHHVIARDREVNLDDNQHKDLDTKLSKDIDIDLLHPCCQKDIKEDRYKQRMKKELGKADRSNFYVKRRKITQEFLRKAPHNRQNDCPCHYFNDKDKVRDRDYPALYQIREVRERAKRIERESLEERENQREREEEERRQRRQKEEVQDREDEYDSDYDSDSSALLEVERIQKARLFSNSNLNSNLEDTNINIGRTINLKGQEQDIILDIPTIEDCCAPTLCHIFDLLYRKDNVASAYYQNLVIHFYHPHDVISGYVDLTLEKLATSYPGTCFLRCDITTANAKLLQIIFPEKSDRLLGGRGSYLTIPSSSSSTSASSRRAMASSNDVVSAYDSQYHKACLVPFLQGERKAIFPLQEFFQPCIQSITEHRNDIGEDGQEILSSEIWKVLTQCHILERELNTLFYTSVLALSKDKVEREEEEEEEEIEYYDCGVKGCEKAFYHQHVNKENQIFSEFNGLINEKELCCKNKDN